jgi:hypothetical protein
LKRIHGRDSCLPRIPEPGFDGYALLLITYNLKVETVKNVAVNVGIRADLPPAYPGRSPLGGGPDAIQVSGRTEPGTR